ncbi:2554_t:CDS:2, partial [Acaulospora colombiana]
GEGGAKKKAMKKGIRSNEKVFIEVQVLPAITEYRAENSKGSGGRTPGRQKSLLEGILVSSPPCQHGRGGQHQESQINEEKDNIVDSPEENETKTKPSSPYAKYAAPDARIWGLYLEEAEAEDKELMEPWNKDLDSLLIFAGLFAGILTAFIVESRKELYEDPQTRLLKDILSTLQNIPNTLNPELFEPETSFLNINGLWFTSLMLTLSSALGGVLSKGWIAKHSSASTRKTSNDAYARHLRANRIRKWR